jgi:hypothetical protein
MEWIVVLIFALLMMWAGQLHTALAANADRSRFVDQELREYPVAASEHVYRGSYVGVNPAGYLKTFVPGDEFVGIAYEEADNSSGAAAAINCQVFVQGDFSLTLTSAALTDVHKPVYATDDNALSLTGHPDAYVGRIVHYITTSTVCVRLRAPGEQAPDGEGSIVLQLTGHETFTATGATAGTSFVGAFELKSILGPGFVVNDEEDGGIEMEFDGTSEVALSSVRTTHDLLPIDKGLTLDVDLVVTDKADAAAVDFDFGFGTALTTDSEASIDHAAMVQLAAFHMDGNSDNILCQSDNDTTDVAPVDSTIDNDSATDVPKHFKIIVRPNGTVEFWISRARVLSSTAFAMLSTANVAAFINAEKTADDTTWRAVFKNLRIGAGMARAA